MISLINRYFVPVYVSNEDYRPNGAAPAEDKKERDRIYHEALKAKLSAGTVHVYILDSDGHCIDSQHVATASKVEELTTMLERTIERLKPAAGEPAVPPAPQSTAPKAEPGSLVLHLTARPLSRQGNDLVVPQKTLGETRSAGWGAYPGEDWIVLTAQDVRRFFKPQANVLPALWDVDPDVATKLLTHFYPPTENNDVHKNHFEEMSLLARTLDVKDGSVRVRLEVKMENKNPFFQKEDNLTVEASVVGYVDYNPTANQVRSLRLVTNSAVYNRLPFGVAVKSVP